MAASMAKHACRNFAVSKNIFRYFSLTKGCHGLRKVHRSASYGCRNFSTILVLQGREYHHDNDEAMSDTRKVNNSSDRRPRNKFEVSQARMREKYNISENSGQTLSDLASDTELKKDSDDHFDDFFGVLSKTENEPTNIQFQERSFDKVVERHPYLVSRPVHNSVKVYETSFGYMTFDGDMKRKKSDSQGDTVPSDYNIIEEQYFGDIDKYDINTNSEKHMTQTETHDTSDGKDYIEGQYFASNNEALPPWQQMNLDNTGNIDEMHSETLTQGYPRTKLSSEQLHHTENVKSHHIEEFSNKIVDDIEVQDYNYASNQTNIFTSSSSIDNAHIETEVSEPYFESYQNIVEGAMKDIESKSKTSEKGHQNQEQTSAKDSPVKKDSVNHAFNSNFVQNAMFGSDTVYIDRKTRLEEKMGSYKKPNLDKPESAFDEALKIRKELRGRKQMEPVHFKDVDPKLQKWKGEKDSKGFRKLKTQVLDVQSLTEEVVVNILKDSILYENDEMLALYKPYGLPSHGGPGVHHSVGKLLSKLAQRLDKQLKNLHLVHRLDKQTTGVIVVAKSEEIAWKLHSMFKKRQVVKKYWVLTKGVPHPAEGVIDIPMGETQVGQYHRMTLRPDYTKDTKLYMSTASKVKKQEAVTNYKVLASNNSVALVECVPESGVKHQIRCHLAFGLNTPILGDHKYSHVSKVAPQRLFPESLQKLGIRQATVRYLPMHLHAKSLIFPELFNGQNVFISARLPKYFIQNMKWLDINIPE